MTNQVESFDAQKQSENGANAWTRASVEATSAPALFLMERSGATTSAAAASMLDGFTVITGPSVLQRSESGRDRTEAQPETPFENGVRERLPGSLEFQKSREILPADSQRGERTPINPRTPREAELALPAANPRIQVIPLEHLEKRRERLEHEDQVTPPTSPYRSAETDTVHT